MENINKTIYYIWLGKKRLPNELKQCIKTWAKYLPEYKIVQINESNYNCLCNKFCEVAYREKLYSYVSDYIRLKIIYENGGIYFDTDVELLKRPSDEILNSSFFARSKNEDSNLGYISTGLGFQCPKHSPILKELMRDYELWSGNSHFGDDSRIKTPACTYFNSTIFLKYGATLENKTIKCQDILFLSSDYFDSFNIRTKVNNSTNNSIAIHHYSHQDIKKIDVWYEYTLQKYKLKHSYTDSIKYMKFFHIIRYSIYWYRHRK